VQKLHEALKDIFREEGRVHVLQEDDGWEESDEAWELGGDEGVIVGAVRQEDEGSWSDACDAWAALDEHAEAGVHHVEAEEGESSGDDPEEGLLVEGEEREYVLELLLREASLEAEATSQPSPPGLASSTSKRKRDLKRKLHKKAKVASRVGSRTAQEDGKKPVNKKEEGKEPRGQLRNPETRGGDVAAKVHNKSDKSVSPPPTLGRECSA
jgi:hypothetical protein